MALLGVMLQGRTLCEGGTSKGHRWVFSSLPHTQLHQHAIVQAERSMIDNNGCHGEVDLPDDPFNVHAPSLNTQPIGSSASGASATSKGGIASAANADKLPHCGDETKRQPDSCSERAPAGPRPLSKGMPLMPEAELVRAITALALAARPHGLAYPHFASEWRQHYGVPVRLQKYG